MTYITMANNDISPEERLFRVIRGGKDSPESGGGEPKKRKPLLDLRAAKQFLYGLKDAAVAKEAVRKIGKLVASFDPREINIRALNKVLVAIAAVMAMTEIYYLVAKRPDIVKITNALSNIQIQETRKAEEAEETKPVNYYLDQIKKRGIFTLKPTAEEAAAPKAAPASAMREAAKDLKLKGIAWGKSPKAMISNEKEGKVYFLGEEQMIGSTGIEIKAILKHKVIISSDDQEMELV